MAATIITTHLGKHVPGYIHDCFYQIRLPLITEARRSQRKVRRSAAGHTSANPLYLSEDSAHLGVLFDSLVVGQWIGGVDPRNAGGRKTDKYENEGASYSMREMSLDWVRHHPSLNGERRGLWMPVLDGVSLCTIHCHNKALSCFLSDRHESPLNDYVVDAVLKECMPNASPSLPSVPAAALKQFAEYLQWIVYFQSSFFRPNSASSRSGANVDEAKKQALDCDHGNGETQHFMTNWWYVAFNTHGTQAIGTVQNPPRIPACRGPAQLEIGRSDLEAAPHVFAGRPGC